MNNATALNIDFNNPTELNIPHTAYFNLYTFSYMCYMCMEEAALAADRPHRSASYFANVHAMHRSNILHMSGHIFASLMKYCSKIKDGFIYNN